MIIRPATEADAAAIAAIYSHNVTHGTAAFEEIAPTADDMAQRLRAVLSKGLPWVVAEVHDRIRPRKQSVIRGGQCVCFYNDWEKRHERHDVQGLRRPGGI
jgi:hypothetical protein